MRRLKVVFHKQRGVPIFAVENIVSLLTHQRKEAFEGERAIRIFQFQTWILFPDDPAYAEWAGLIAAAKVLDQLDENIFVADKDAQIREEDLRTMVDLSDRPPQKIKRLQRLQREHLSFRKIYDQFIGESGGLLGLVNSPTTEQFDRLVANRVARMNIVSDLIDYRLRYIEHPLCLRQQNAASANHNHAMFFCWWPTHEIEGERGKTPDNKSVTPRTIREWWKKMEMSAIFVYLINKHRFDQLPPQSSGNGFVDRLQRASKARAELLRFFGAYAYIVDAFSRVRTTDLPYVNIADSIPRVAVSTTPFTKAELATIDAYDDNYLEMNE
jgi:hypothetical protein